MNVRESSVQYLCCAFTDKYLFLQDFTNTKDVDVIFKKNLCLQTNRSP